MLEQDEESFRINRYENESITQCASEASVRIDGQ